MLIGKSNLAGREIQVDESLLEAAWARRSREKGENIPRPRGKWRTLEASPPLSLFSLLLFASCVVALFSNCFFSVAFHHKLSSPAPSPTWTLTHTDHEWCMLVCVHILWDGDNNGVPCDIEHHCCRARGRSGSSFIPALQLKRFKSPWFRIGLTWCAIPPIMKSLAVFTVSRLSWCPWSVHDNVVYG